ncbi:hypothetical protein FB562_2197 [Homoserinimonas aerilata]|uniref:HK97 gp10 family phage protein n=1 Tax=Homoserinimonas aerilata TaxID=1162970 RepID=A0A542YF07_9MICO|nr:hypothetical protein [Homoserinimonas aerilata]TQL46673.1 hypothetical protein FB562_2197 [Homoserinimonas aerilata]
MGVRADVQMTVKFGDVMESILAGTVQGMNQAGELLLAKTQEQVPMDEGTLASSGTVVQAKTIGDPVQVVYDTPYAARLHEHPEYNFSTDSNPGAKGKYVEDPAVENRKAMGDVIRSSAQRGQISG